MLYSPPAPYSGKSRCNTAWKCRRAGDRPSQSVGSAAKDLCDVKLESCLQASRQTSGARLSTSSRLSRRECAL